MKITSVKSVVASAETGGIPRNYVFVKIETDEGITGWGESTLGPMAVATLVDEFGKRLVGEDPSQIEKHWQMLYYHQHSLRGGAIQMSAISGIEIALWDIKGQVLGVPVYELLGGKIRDKIWCYGRWDGLTPEAAIERAEEFTSQGITALKGDPFDHQGIFIDRESEKRAIEKMRRVREHVGDDVELLVEAHGRLSTSDAIRIGLALEEYRPFMYEEPVPPENLDALKKVADSINIPIATGERLYTKWDYAGLFPLQAVALIQPDIVQAGGLLELKKIAAMAEAHYVGFQPHNPYGPICTVASLHLDACTPNFLIQEGGLDPWFQDAVIGNFPKQKDGFLPLPEGAGLGIAIDEDWVLRNPWNDDAIWTFSRGTITPRQQVGWP
ncbi:MAG: galactonate dehydratase [Gammaproteobacteria bacterium]|nr:galactonate dehydratase [Gammaproteobacteria bacterium]